MVWMLKEGLICGKCHFRYDLHCKQMFLITCPICSISSHENLYSRILVLANNKLLRLLV